MCPSMCEVALTFSVQQLGILEYALPVKLSVLCVRVDQKAVEAIPISGSRFLFVAEAIYPNAAVYP